MGSFSPFNPNFDTFQFNNPFDDEEEERRRRLLQGGVEDQLQVQPSFDMPQEDVGGGLPEVEEPKGSITDAVDRGLAVAEGEGGQDYLSQYAEHLGNRPERPDPSTLRKILSVIGGTLAGGSPDITRQLAGYGGYDEEMADWREGGAGLGEVADIEQKHAASRQGLGGRVMTAGTKREGDVEAHTRGQRAATTGEGNLAAREGELAERTRAAGVTEGHAATGLELEGRRAGAAETTAATGARRADIYGKNVDSLITTRAEGGGGRDPTMSPSQQGNLEQQALDDVISMNPAWEKFARFHETTGDVLGRAGQVPGEGPGPDFFYGDSPAAEDPEYQEFITALELARNRRAGTAGLEEVPPLPSLPE